MLGLVRKLMELIMKSDLQSLISVTMLAMVLEKISLRMSLFVEGVMLKSLACQSIAGWCLLCLAVISFQIMTALHQDTDSQIRSTACSTHLLKPSSYILL